MNAGHCPTAITPAGARFKAWCSCGWKSTPRVSPRAALDAIECEHGWTSPFWNADSHGPEWNATAKIRVLTSS